MSDYALTSTHWTHTLRDYPAATTDSAGIPACIAGEAEESVNLDTTQNLIIEGDNLEVLKLLQKSYLGKVKMMGEIDSLSWYNYPNLQGVAISPQSPTSAKIAFGASSRRIDLQSA